MVIQNLVVDGVQAADVKMQEESKTLQLLMLKKFMKIKRIKETDHRK
jgi:hypothetical protein